LQVINYPFVTMNHSWYNCEWEWACLEGSSVNRLTIT